MASPGASPGSGRPPVLASKLHPGVAEPGAVPAPRKVTAERLPPAAAPAPAAEAPAPAGPASPGSGTSHSRGSTEAAAHQDGWVQQLLEELWPYARDAAQRLAWQTIPPTLEASRPPWVYELSLEEFSLGDARPAVRDIRVRRGGGAGLEELVLEFEAEWRSQQDVRLLIVVPRLPVAVAEVTPDPLEQALRMVARLRVRLCGAWVRAGVRVTLRPLLRRLPVVGALQVGLTRLPEFGYELDLSLASAALVPLVREWLDGAVRDLVLQPHVLPEHLFFPLEPGIEDVERPVGVLAVTVMQADDVPKPGLLGAARPMLELFVRDSQRRQTHVAPLAGGAAAWGSRFEFPVSLPEHQELSLILYDFNEFSPNVELGRAQLALRALPPGRQRDFTLLLWPKAEEHAEEEARRLGAMDRLALALGRPFTKKGGQAARLHLQVTYIPLSEDEVRMVMEQQRLPVPARDGGGGAAAALPPPARRLLRSGLLLVRVPRVDGVPSGGLFKPHVKLVVRVGRRQAETDAAQASRQGAAEFSRPAALHLEPEALQGSDAQVELELLQHNWRGGVASLGRLALPLGPLLDGEKAAGERRLEGGGFGQRARLQLEASFRPYF